MAHDVYISFSSQDKVAADDLCQALEAAGVCCWVAPRDIAPGQEWSRAILDAISASRLLLLILSKNSSASAHVRREVTYAMESGLQIVPFRIDDAAMDAAMRYALAGLQMIDAGSDRQQAKRLLVQTSQRILGDRILRHSVETVAPTYADRSPPPLVSQPSIWKRILNMLASIFSPRVDQDSPPAGVDDETSEDTSIVQLVDHLSVPRMEDLAERRVAQQFRSILAGLISDLPERLDRVAERAGQAIAIQDPNRKMIVLEDALRDLSGMQNELLDRTGQAAESAAAIVTRWTELFRGARDKAQAAADEASELENPFVFGNPVRSTDEGLFTGRRDLVLEIERNILRAAQAPTLLLYGQRRMGKTSILNQLPKMLGPGYLPVLVDCQAPATVESQAALLRHLSRCLSAPLNSRLGIAYEDTATQEARGSVAIPLEALQASAFSTFEDWLDRYFSRVPAGTNVLLCLDEFERLKEAIDAGWGARFLDALRHWLQHRAQLALMFIGTHTFEQLGPKWTDRFLSARRIKVTFLQENEVRQLLTQPTPTFRLKYEPAALQAIVEAAHGQPFLTQVLASELVHHMNREGRKLATASDVAAAIDDTLERSAEYFADLWSSRTEEEQRLLLEAAVGKYKPPTDGVARGLRDYDILNEQGAYAVPLVRKWVRENKLKV